MQKEIVAEIEGYQKVIDGLNVQIIKEGQKIQSAIARIWGKEEPET